MSPRSRLREHLASLPLVGALAGAALLFGSAAAWAGGSDAEGAGLATGAAALPLLPPLYAAAGSVDTAFVGGFARGDFAEALPVLASDLAPAERAMVGRHLDRIYLPLLREQGLEGGGRLRLAFERRRRPDGTTRSIQVLAAEVAVGGEMHTLFLFERPEGPGYFDDLGRSLEPRSGWSQPLAAMRVTSPFNTARMHPILRRVLPHKGMDLAARQGTPVHATGDGSVSTAGVSGGYGNLVEVQHPNGLATRYAHLAGFAPGVRPGTQVRQGQVIGYVGSTGLSTGPHLHYEVRRKGVPMDPAGVQVGGDPGNDVGYDPQWRDQRRQLGRLLARAPTVVSARGRTAGR